MESKHAIPRLLIGVCLLQAFGCSESDPPLPQLDPQTVRTIAEGEVVGFTSAEGAHVWRGIPFAQPPEGELRWRAPVLPGAWEGRREARRFGAPCMQFGGPLSSGDAPAGEPTGSEDCLTLNVFSPPFRPEEVPVGLARRPVMVWIHGGGNTIGDARLYDGSRLARDHDVIVVTVQYRLGVFGWFSHPALRDGTSERDDSGNYGTLDLVRALDWVKENITSFGGDPRRVTIFGESAGGGNVFSLLLSPAAKGRFQRAIVQSGRPRSVSRAEAENYTDDAEPGRPFSSREVMLLLLEREGRAADRADAKRQLATLSDAEAAAWLRGVEPAALFAIFGEPRPGGLYESPRLIRDGSVLPREDHLARLARRGGSNEVPVILGSNRDENKLFLLPSSPHVRRIAGIPEGLADERRYELDASYTSQMWKALAVDDPATAIRKIRSDVYAYRFDWDDERSLLWLDLGKLLGAAHFLEVPFMFGTLKLDGAEKYLYDPDRAEDDRRLADAMTSYWTRFAATGNPGKGREGELSDWEPWDAAGGSFLLLDSEHDGGIRMSDDTVTREGVLSRLASDPRFQDEAERCEIYKTFAERFRTIPPKTACSSAIKGN
jgi:para-nitrobenzyl esterase